MSSEDDHTSHLNSAGQNSTRMNANLPQRRSAPPPRETLPALSAAAVAAALASTTSVSGLPAIANVPGLTGVLGLTPGMSSTISTTAAESASSSSSTPMLSDAATPAVLSQLQDTSSQYHSLAHPDNLVKRVKMPRLTRSQKWEIGSRFLANPDAPVTEYEALARTFGCSIRTVRECRMLVLRGEITDADRDVHRTMLFPNGRMTEPRKITEKIKTLALPHLTPDKYFHLPECFYWMRRVLSDDPTLDDGIELIRRATELESQNKPPSHGELDKERNYLHNANFICRKLVGGESQLSNSTNMTESQRFVWTLLQLMERVRPENILFVHESLISEAYPTKYIWELEGTPRTTPPQSSMPGYRAAVISLTNFAMQLAAVGYIRKGKHLSLRELNLNSLDSADLNRSSDASAPATSYLESKSETHDMLTSQTESGSEGIQTQRISMHQETDISTVHGIDDTLMQYVYRLWQQRVLSAGKIFSDIESRYSVQWNQLKDRVQKFAWHCIVLDRIEEEKELHSLLWKQFEAVLATYHSLDRNEVHELTRKVQISLPIPKVKNENNLKESRIDYILSGVNGPYSLEGAPYTLPEVIRILKSKRFEELVERMCDEAVNDVEMGGLTMERKQDLIENLARKFSQFDPILADKCILSRLYDTSSPEGWVNSRLMVDLLENVVPHIYTENNFADLSPNASTSTHSRSRLSSESLSSSHIEPHLDGLNDSNAVRGVIILDRSSPHLSPSVLDTAKENGIMLLYLPASLTSSIQVPDEDFFASRKSLLAPESRNEDRKVFAPQQVQFDDSSVLVRHLGLMTNVRDVAQHQRVSSIVHAWRKVFQVCLPHEFSLKLLEQSVSSASSQPPSPTDASQIKQP